MIFNVPLYKGFRFVVTNLHWNGNIPNSAIVCDNCAKERNYQKENNEKRFACSYCGANLSENHRDKVQILVSLWKAWKRLNV